MPAPALPRHNRPLSPPISSNTTPARPKHVHAMNSLQTSTSYSPTVTAGGQQQKLNVVTRLAMEGRAKQGQDGASIKMYLKISLPLDSVSPGMTVPLFQEENVKILTSQVHPLDNHSVPYNFSSTISPLLHNAARALSLPARSSETFDSVFGLSSSLASNISVSSSSARSARSSPPLNSENIPPVDGQYIGHILVSGYNISYVLPRSFPARNRNAQSETEGESSSMSGRRMSIGERNSAQFMAAIDMWIPYVSRPPRSPYLLSIPTPRCLHNNIKLRIFPPTIASSSFASLSSVDDDGGTWDLTSDPHVTRTATSRSRRSNSYGNFADDESSDSSAPGFSGGVGIQGTFPSAERVRVRWAKPLKNVDTPGSSADGRRRVGVQEVKGETTCVVRGKAKAPEKNGAEGVLMDIQYKGTCKGVWFPGVATLLGMDVGLEAKNSDVYWPEGGANEWDIGGGKGYTGFDVGSSPRQNGLITRANSLDSNAPQGEDEVSVRASRTNSSSSTSSLLRGPLPAKVADYSFESSGGPPSPTSPTLSSMSSLIPSLSVDPTINPPGTPITLHLNMNELVTPAKNTFTFTISGTVLIVARPTISRLNKQESETSDSESDPEPITPPRFTVLAADSESTTTIVRNEIAGPSVNLEVYNSTGDIHRDPQARKTVLQRSGFTKCAEDGSRIAFKTIGMMNGFTRTPQHPNRPRTLNGRANHHVTPHPPFDKTLPTPRPKREGPLMIPSVMATVTLLMRNGESSLEAYAIRLALNAPDTGSEWLEFGLARPDISLGAEVGKTRKVILTSVTLDGVPVRYETTPTSSRSERNESAPAFEKMNGQEWITWARLDLDGGGGGVVVVDYLVEETGVEKAETKAKAANSPLRILLPTFPIPVGKSEVGIEGPSETKILSIDSNFTYEQSMSTGHKCRLLNFSNAEFFYPRLSILIGPASTSTPRRSRTWIGILVLLTWILLFAGIAFIHRLGNQMEQTEQVFREVSAVVGAAGGPETVSVTVTTTVYRDRHPGTCRLDQESATRIASVSSEQTSVLSRTASSTTLTFITPVRTAAPEPEPESETIPTVTLAPTRTGAMTLSVSSATAAESHALLSMHHMFPMHWPMSEEWQATFEKVMESVDVVWQVFRKIYHYPLDPP